MTHKQHEKLKQFDTSKFTRETSCVVKAFPAKKEWEILSLHKNEFEAEKIAEKLWQESDDQGVLYTHGCWFEGRFIFDDPNHSATLTVPSSLAEKFGLEDELASHLEECEDDEELDRDEFTEGVLQVHQHPWEFDELEEDELLRYWGYDPEMLNQGAHFTGWMDG